MNQQSRFAYTRHLWFLPVIFALLCSPVLAGEASVLKGKVTDVEGRPVEGARIFVYGSTDVRRSGDFISPPTDQHGLFRMALSPGKYWALARLKKMDGYGPLAAGDKHSGEPAEIEIAAGQEMEKDFMIADLKEAQKIKTKDREGPIKITGRILDEKGSPVTNAYAVANKIGKLAGMPDFVSAWVDTNGTYTLYLPRGKYYIGSAVAFPPDELHLLKEPVVVHEDRTELDIVRIPSKPVKK